MRQRFLAEEMYVSRGFLLSLVFLFVAVLAQTWGSFAMLVGYYLIWIYSMIRSHLDNKKAWAEIKERAKENLVTDQTHPWVD